jgi:N-acetylmuramoyl-L-alanine amidase
MQKMLHREVMGAMNRWEITDRGLKRAAFYVLRQNPCPAVLIESLFLDNEREARIWREPPFAEALAAGVARGVRAALGHNVTENAPLVEYSPVTQPSALRGELGGNKGGMLYSVQVGTFACIENARQRLAEAREAGFTDAYIYQKQL